VRDLSLGLSARGFEVDVLATSGSRRSWIGKDGPVTVHVMAEFARLKGTPISPGFPFTIRRGGYDIVHLHIPTPLGELSLGLFRRGALGFATYHADHYRYRLLGHVYGGIHRRSLPSYSHVLTSSDQLIDSSPVLSAVRRKHPDLLKVVPFGIDTDKFSPKPTPAAEQIRAGWGTDPVVLYVGRIADYKGLPTLVEALRKVNARLVVIGEGLESADLDRYARGALQSRYLRIPYCPDEELPNLYRASDVFCLPSNSAAETFGLAALEAMSCGIPVITTELGTATSRTNVDGKTGFVVPPNDPLALRRAAERLIDDPGLRKKMGEAARARVTDLYTLARMISGVEATYRSALYDKAAHRRDLK
jgi:rhamnosyl/mannosyltransferase